MSDTPCAAQLETADEAAVSGGPCEVEVHQAGGRTILEYWIPAEELIEFNANIVGLIEVIAEDR